MRISSTENCHFRLTVLGQRLHRRISLGRPGGWCCWWLLSIGIALPASAQSLTQDLQREPVQSLAAAAREQGNAVRGAILFTQQQLQCTRCHNADTTPAIGPNLTGLGKDISDVELVEALLEPSKRIRRGYESTALVTSTGAVWVGRVLDDGPDKVVMQLSSGAAVPLILKPGDIEERNPSPLSIMPANLVDQLVSRQQFLDLIRYVMELVAAEPPQPASALAAAPVELDAELQGLVLLKEFNCQACHRDDLPASLLSAKQAPQLSQSIDSISSEFLQRFIAQPHQTRPRTTMPDLMSHLSPEQRQQAAEELTSYLLSLSPKRFAPRSPEPEAAARGAELFHSVGCVACHSPRGDDQQELLMDASVPLGPVHDKYSLDGLAAFLENPLAVRPAGRMPHLNLSHWEAIDLASYLLSHPNAPEPESTLASRNELIDAGRQRFHQLGCQHCHQVTADQPLPPAVAAMAKPQSTRSLSTLRLDEGCLSNATGVWPKFSLTPSQRAAIQAALRRPAQPLTNQEHIAVTLSGLRCVNCHERDQLGGITDARDSYFQTTNPNLGPQGRIPPTLTGVGAKLNPTWMRQVLVSGRAIRPYVLTRMPQFGADNVAHLVDLFQATDHLPELEFPRIADQKKAREAGNQLAGTDGLNCIVCHTFQLQEAANMPAVDLTEMAERLKKNWFFHYMREPQSLSRNTIMPSFWPAGKAMRADILDGSSELQIEALWQYLVDGRQARPPRGLIVEPMELLAEEQAVMLRRSYPGVGKRGIGVGYPRQLNLVFDAEQIRLAMLWKGRFADPGGVWRSQGHGVVRPLGEQVLRFLPGPDLDYQAEPWSVDESRPPYHQFSGYALDEQSRPRFRYAFAGIRVEDYWVDEVDATTAIPFMRRTLTFIADQPRSDVRFRVASGLAITQLAPGKFAVDGQLQLQLSGETTPQIVTQLVDGAEVQQLVIPLQIKQGPNTLTVDYRW